MDKQQYDYEFDQVEAELGFEKLAIEKKASQEEAKFWAKIATEYAEMSKQWMDNPADRTDEDDCNMIGEVAAFRCERPDLAPSLKIQEDGEEEVDERF